MRGADSYNESLFTTVKLEDFVPANHPLRPIRTWVTRRVYEADAMWRCFLRPNVRAKRATTAGRQARAGENVPRTARPGLVACRWRSA